MEGVPLRRNLILDTDSYKSSHWLQYPPDTTGMYSYFESRGGKYGSTVFFGLQYLLREYLSGPVVSMADVDEAERFFEAHGEPFNRPAWAHLVEKHGGCLPIRVRAVAEGSVVPTHNVLMSAESTDPELFWLVSWLETILVRLWYPITVATQSFYMKKDILDALTTSADDPLAEHPVQAPRLRLPRRVVARVRRHRRHGAPRQLPGVGHGRGGPVRQPLLRPPDGGLLHPRRRTLHDHRCGAAPASSTPTATWSSSSRGPGRRWRACPTASTSTTSSRATGATSSATTSATRAGRWSFAPTPATRSRSS